MVRVSDSLMAFDFVGKGDHDHNRHVHGDGHRGADDGE